jgi:CPA1 family monovalent cation:H+ antiporter
MTTSPTIEFLIWMLIVASVIAVAASRLRIPYTVALVLGGLALASVRPSVIDPLISGRVQWLAPDVLLTIFLPPLLFEGGLTIRIRDLRDTAAPILLLATLGVLVTTTVTGVAVHWALGMPMLVALVFGAVVAATDPISVLAIFKDIAAPKRLSVIVEGESLFNDGTALVIFRILLAGVAAGSLSVRSGIHDFLIAVLGGGIVGIALGYLCSSLTRGVDDPQVEITLTTILAYGAYLTAEALHMSGVIATVAGGLMIGNVGARFGMSPRTRIALWSFWGYVSFVINSIVFLLIGLQVRVSDMLVGWRSVLVALSAVVLGRMVVVYALAPLSGIFGTKIPRVWQHALVLGGMRGALSLALALSLAATFPYRSQILVMTFGVVAFTIIGQGLTMRPLLRRLGIASSAEGELERTRVRQIALAAAQSELEQRA